MILAALMFVGVLACIAIPPAFVLFMGWVIDCLADITAMERDR